MKHEDGRWRCNCGRFVRDVVASIESTWIGEHLGAIHATCSRCGRVELRDEVNGPCWEDFYGWGDDEERAA